MRSHLEFVKLGREVTETPAQHVIRCLELYAAHGLTRQELAYITDRNINYIDRALSRIRLLGLLTSDSFKNGKVVNKLYKLIN